MRSSRFAEPGGDPWIVRARRTAIGTAGHAFAAADTSDLAAPLLADAARALELSGAAGIDEVILGNCMGPGGNVARVATLAAGLGPQVPAVTVDRQCGSGLDAVLQGAARIRAGEACVVLAGGVESASTQPWRYWPATGPDPTDPGGDPERPAVRYTRAPFAPPGFPDPDMGAAADHLARLRGHSREQVDAYAAASHQKAWQATQQGRFEAEIVAVRGIRTDDRPRPGLTAQRLGRLRPAFTADGPATAGNSCGVSDGAALLTLVDGRRARPDRGAGALRILAAAATGGDPALPGNALSPAVRSVLSHPRVSRLGLRATDIDIVEITEAFASVALAAIEDLGLDPRRVCADGGAIGLGHPWAASGALLLVRLAHRMDRDPAARYGLAACAIGGGQGIAALVERVSDPAR